MRPDMEGFEAEDLPEKLPETLEFCCPRCGYTILVATDRTPYDKDILIDPQRRVVGIPLGWTVETSSVKTDGAHATERRYGWM